MQISFLPVQAQHLEQLRQWRNSPRIRAQMFQQQEISAADQRRWFAQLACDPSRQVWVCCLDQQPVGCLTFSQISAQGCEWGCYRGVEVCWPGIGLMLEIAALDYAFNQLQVAELRAEVLTTNVGPQQMHKKVGYQHCGRFITVHSIEGVALQVERFTYQRNAWLAQRAEVLGRFPKNMQLMAEQMQFLPASPVR
ncbi:MAG: UDP-4-amino-4,6-dideoxy-N-acetyl-beta-L-altrosamine N-acetyltransferase [Aeromonas sp.]